MKRTLVAILLSIAAFPTIYQETIDKVIAITENQYSTQKLKAKNSTFSKG